MALRTRSDTRQHAALLILQSLTALYLVWLYPNFLVTALLVVVAWQIAWSTATPRKAIAAVLALSAALAAMKCVDQADGMTSDPPQGAARARRARCGARLRSACGCSSGAASAAWNAASWPAARSRG